jgi:hypothetical protein
MWAQEIRKIVIAEKLLESFKAFQKRSAYSIFLGEYLRW